MVNFEENYLDSKEVARRLSLNGRAISRATIARWALNGVRLPDGTVVRLRSVRFGKKLAISENSLNEFITAMSGAGGSAADTPQSPAARRQAVSRVTATLNRKKVGVRKREPACA